MEYEIRFYYPLTKYKEKLLELKKIKDLNIEGRKYEITSQFDHPSKKFSFYTKEVDGRFRIRKTESKKGIKCMISWKRRLNDTVDKKINKEEEVEISINSKDYDNLMFLINNVLHMKEIETYERYRTTFSNEEIEIVLDEYPFGLALEIEAKKNIDNPEKIINKYITLLNLKYEDSYKLSWDDKYEQLCKEQKMEKFSKVLFDKPMPKIK